MFEALFIHRYIEKPSEFNGSLDGAGLCLQYNQTKAWPENRDISQPRFLCVFRPFTHRTKVIKTERLL